MRADIFTSPGDVDHAEHVAARVQDRHRGASQELVGLDEVFVGVDQGRALGDQRGADRVGAPGLLGPVDPRLQRDLRRAGQEVVVADAVDDGAAGVGQQHHAVRVGDLLVQDLHHRRGMGVQAAVAFAHRRQLGQAERRKVRPLQARQADRSAAVVRLQDRFAMGVVQRRGERPCGAIVAVCGKGGERFHQGAFVGNPA
jgi:hypothetical protein